MVQWKRLKLWDLGHGDPLGVGKTTLCKNRWLYMNLGNLSMYTFFSNVIPFTSKKNLVCDYCM